MDDESNQGRASDPPREFSAQNREEPSAPQPGSGQGSSEAADTGHPPDSERSTQSGQGRPGGAGEGSQATGHPENAG